ncbi:MAG: hypothetical protein ACT4NL_11255 [Pseudomarimonas sp.]
MPPLMLIGVALFFAGAALFMLLLFSHGGAGRSQQFGVIADLLGGRRGVGKRRLTIAALILIGLGAFGTFAGVAAMDARRANRCQDYCIASGYQQGKIGPSMERSKERRFVACTCDGGKSEPLELRADSVP